MRFFISLGGTVKKALMFALLVLFAVSSTIFAAERRGDSSGEGRKKGTLTVSGRVSLYDPPGDAGYTPMYGLSARYSLSDKVELEGNVEYTSYNDDGKVVKMMPVTFNGLLHPLGQRVFDPYFGLGIGAYLKKIDNEDRSTMGLQGVGGVQWHPKSGCGFSFEVRYLVPDGGNFSDGSFTFGGSITGEITTEL